MTIEIGRFGEYFARVHGVSPFPWQTRLLETVMNGGWPKSIALPTASGKTAVMDVALFALACQAGLSPEERTAPRRIVLVVDRRIVVDDAYGRARKIRDTLRGALGVPAESGVAPDPATDILREMAQALVSLGGDDSLPVDAALLRGGIYREDRWARTPAQPVILCSTVDQVGSRLLFRGYGLSSSTWPLHAGLLGNDTLLVLDEAHCSKPFLQTLERISEYRARGETPLALPFFVTAMTATPRSGEEPFELNREDRSNAVLQKRLGASKHMRLVALPKKSGSAGKSSDKDIAAACVEFLSGDGAEDGLAKKGTTVLVVLNRVAAARALREKLRQKEKRGALKVILLTGRSRSVERDTLLQEYRDRIMAGRDRGRVKEFPPLVVVATQCVEVGADLDADALITEACPLDALRQRMGRLDRLGELGKTEAVCFLRSEYQGDTPPPDPIYGEALVDTWKWLKENLTKVSATTANAAGKKATTANAADGEINCGIDALAALLPEDPAVRERLCTPSADAPVLFAAYCDIWCQTGPEPAVCPEPALFLHGSKDGPGDVRLLWRADLVVDPNSAAPERLWQIWTDTVALCPPVSGETLPLPIGEARAWLRGDSAPDSGDIEGSPGPKEGKTREDVSGTVRSASRYRKALRWLGPERSEPVSEAAPPRPGDVLILSASEGGCDSEGWNPSSTSAVADVADLVRLKARRPAVLRLHPNLFESWSEEARSLVAPFAECKAFGELPGDMDDIEERMEELLRMLQSRNDLSEASAEVVRVLCKDPDRRIEPHPSGTGLVVYTKVRLGEADFTDEDSQSVLAREDLVSLKDHLETVEAQARQASVSLSETLRNDISLAAKLHDLGKADPRFQIWLAGGNRVKARKIFQKYGLLAKSSLLHAGPGAMRTAREKAGYPAGGRHELLSVRLVQSCEELLQRANDPDLLLHLIECHHGYARPFAPVVEDPNPVRVSVPFMESSSATELDRLDSGVAERFWRLVRRYGWWGLAYLEACLRLADHRASEKPTRKSSREGTP